MTRLWLCLLTDRDCQRDEAAAILALDPENQPAKAVLSAGGSAAP